MLSNRKPFFQVPPMPWRPPEPGDPAHWRRRAEELLGGEEAEAPGSVELTRVVHELRVHQLELEMQNEALQEARLVAEAGWERFQELYDSSPAGYFSLDAQGAILELNLTGAHLLGADQTLLANRRFQQFLGPADQAAFAGFLRHGLENREPRLCEVSLPGPGPAPVRVRLQGASSADGKVLQMAAMPVVFGAAPDRPAKVDLGTVAEDLKGPLERLDQYSRLLLSGIPGDRPDHLGVIARAIEDSSRKIRALLERLQG
jgi:PAS domain-containing protein